jgi:putative ubiquitin-RnfH superfamily antitoxin RatB of RatAB toxin-antitoxin module
MAPVDRIAVEVAYSPGPSQLEIIPLELEEGATLAQALELSGLLERYPDLQSAGLVCAL